MHNTIVLQRLTNTFMVALKSFVAFLHMVSGEWNETFAGDVFLLLNSLQRVE